MVTAPGRGDLIWIQFDPQAGHEQAGRRPALVLSPQRYNEKRGLAILCPITSKVKGNPFEVGFVSGKLQGVILSDQIKSLDWRTRAGKTEGRVSQDVIEEVLAKAWTLLSPPD